MTGYASRSFQVEPSHYTVELRSVNSRNADVRVKLPWSAPGVEAALAARVRKAYHRGRVDVVVRAAVDEATPGASAATEQRLVQAYEELQRLSARLGLAEPPTLRDLVTYLASRASLVAEGRTPPVGFESRALEALDPALESWDEMRVQEGARMVTAVRELLGEASEHVAAIESVASVQPRRLAEKTRQRVETLLGELGAAADAVEASRLTGEIALLADRADVTEEIVRLRSHFEQFDQVLTEGEAPHGRKLDFLLQEMLREINTTGAKAPDSQMSTRVVEVKAQLEKIREVIQNIE
jgi:uncharacterized protein (TIGR00255 family)